MQVFDTFTDVINQEKIDRWIAPAITPIAVTKKHGERKKSVHQWHRGQSKSLSLKLELQVTLEGSNFDLLKFSISRSKTAVPYFYSIKLRNLLPIS